MIGEIKGISALDAEKVAVDTALVAVIATNNLHATVAAANAESSLAAVSAMCADRAHVVHLPRAGLIAICAGGERANRANIDAHAALFAFEVILFVRSDYRTNAARSEERRVGKE